MREAEEGLYIQEAETSITSYKKRRDKAMTKVTRAHNCSRKLLAKYFPALPCVIADTQQ